MFLACELALRIVQPAVFFGCILYTSRTSRTYAPFTETPFISLASQSSARLQGPGEQ